MATLQGQKVQDTYGDLLQVSNSNDGIDTTLRQVVDGKNTSSELYLQQSGTNRGIALGNGTDKPIIFGGITKASPYAMKYSGSTSTLGDAITGLTGGSTAGFLLASGPANAHVVITLSANDINDGFHILGPTTPALDAALDANYFSVQPHEVVINESSRDMDFRWESDTSHYGFFCEGSTGNVAIGTNDTSKRLTVNGGISSSGMIEMNTLSAKTGIISNPGGVCNLEIGRDQTSNNYAFIDLVGDTTYTDFALRIIRGNAGPNSDSAIQHRGTGSLGINAVDVASIKILTNNQQRLVVKSDGKVGIGTDAPNHELTVVGDISATGTIHGTTAGGDWTFLGSPVDLSFDTAESIVVSSGGNAGKLLATSGSYDNVDYRIVPIAGLHGVPSSAKYVMCHVYVGQADFYGIDPHVGTAQPIGFNPHLNTSNNNNTRGNVVLGIGAVPFPRLSNSTGDPGIGNATNATLSVDGGLTGGVSEVYYPSSETAQGMSRSDSIVFVVIDQDSDGTGVLHTLRILAYK